MGRNDHMNGEKTARTKERRDKLQQPEGATSAEGGGVCGSSLLGMAD